MPGSAKKYTQAQIDDGFIRDWFPDEHPRCRDRRHRRKPARACALCIFDG